MSTLLEKRQQATINNLLKRRTSAQTAIKNHTDKLEVKLTPYRNELQVVEKMLERWKALQARLARAA